MPVTEENIPHLLGLSPVHEELANIRLKSIELLAEKTPDDPSIEPKVARAHALLGMISTQVGSFQRAREHLEKAVDLYGQIAMKNPNLLEHRLGVCRALLELGYLYWDDDRKPVARRFYEQALERLERECARSASDLETAYELGVCLVGLGRCLPDDASVETRKKLATRAMGLFEPLIERKHREADSRAGLAVASYRLTLAGFDGKDQQGLLKSLDAISHLDEAALLMEPASPRLNTFAIFTHQDKAEALLRLGKPKEALSEREAALAKARAIVKQTPDMCRCNAILAEVLVNLGRDLRRLDRTADARTAFDECLQISDDLVRRFPDRAYFASRWVIQRNTLAEFFEYGPKPQGEIQARQDLLRTLDVTVQRGREMAARFPDHYSLQFGFATALASRGRYDRDAERNENALPYLLEAAEVYRTRVLAARDQPEADDVSTYLNQLQAGATCAGSLGKADEVIRLSHLALQVGKQCTSRTGADDFGTILDEAAKLHRNSGHHAEAVQAYSQAIQVRRSALEKAPWHWHLESGLGESYKQLAETYREAGDFRNEVLANREFLKIVIGPRYGAKIEDYIDPSRPVNEAEANRIRELIKEATATGMKRFTVPCDLDGIKFPFYLYVTNVPWPKHPLEGQARWLREERGGTVPQDVLDSFRGLQKIAHENNVSFVDLCVLALATPGAGEGRKTEDEKILDPTAVAASPETPSKAARDPLAALKARLVDAKMRHDKAPGDLATTREAAQLYHEFGQSLLKANNARESAEALRESVRLRELLARAQPTVTEHRQLLAATFLALGHSHEQLKEFDAAYNCFHRRLDLLEQLQVDAPSAEQRSALTERYVIFGQLAELQGERTDALRWYSLAAEQKGSRAAPKIANLLQLDRSLADVLPKNLQNLFIRLEDDGATTGPTFIAVFDKEVEAMHEARERLDAVASGLGLDQRGQIRWLTGFAESYRSLAAKLLEQSKGKDALDAYLKEAELRDVIVRLDGPDQNQKDNYGRVLLDAAMASIDLGKTSDGIRLLERAQQFDAEKATFFLASLYEHGKGVPANVRKARSMRSDFTFKKGLRLYDQKKYSEALVEFERSVTESPSVGGYQWVGWCQRKLGRIEEAIATFKRSIDLGTRLNDCREVVLDLVEAALSANQPEVVFAVLRILEAKNWVAEGTDRPYTFEREMTGMRAIALHMAGRDATEAERKLEEIISRPNFSSLRSRNLELDAWLKGSHPSDARQAAVKKIVALLDAPARELTSPYFPLASGRNWVYKDPDAGRVVVRATRSDEGEERKYWLLETVVNGKVTQTEQIAIESDGVYRQSSTLPLRQPGVRVLPVPARGGDSWAIKSVNDPSGGIGKGVTRVEDVTVPAGEYKGAIVAEIKTGAASSENVQMVWYAKGVGPVKIVTKTNSGMLTWELEKVITLSASYSFHKSGKLKEQTAADLQKADASSAIICLTTGQLSDGRQFYAYVAVRPSKYHEFHQKTVKREVFVINDYGKVIISGFEPEPPPDVVKHMRDNYGYDENFVDKLQKKSMKREHFSSSSVLPISSRC